MLGSTEEPVAVALLRGMQLTGLFKSLAGELPYCLE
jgi:hypothetical protein